MEKRERDCGIDLLRLLSMFLVVVYHLLFHGGVLETGGLLPRLLWAMTLCAVDCFGLISGYVGYREESPRLPVERMKKFWLQIVTYSVGLLLVTAWIYPPVLSKGSLVRAMLPIASDQYWYATAYMGVCLLAPWLNYLIWKLNRQELFRLAWSLLLVFCLYSTLANPLSENFRMWGGCHFAWLTILYVVGAALGRDGWLERLPRAVAFGGFLLCGVLLWLLPRDGLLGSLQLFRNSSPVVLAMSLCLTRLCLGLRATRVGRKLLGWMAPAAFGVYLLHDHPAVREVLIAGRFAGLTGEGAVILLAGLLVPAMGIFVAGILLERLRMHIYAKACGILRKTRINFEKN